MILTSGQSHALQLFCSGENLLLLGDPGTGKSTLISVIVQQAEKNGKRVAKTNEEQNVIQTIRNQVIVNIQILRVVVRKKKRHTTPGQNKSIGINPNTIRLL